MAHRRAAGTALLALVLAAATACSGASTTAVPATTAATTTAAATTTTPPDRPGAEVGLSADVLQGRSDVEGGVLQVHLRVDPGGAPVAVAGVDLVTPAFPRAGPGRAVDLAPGQQVDVPLVAGAAAGCPAAALPVDATSGAPAPHPAAARVRLAGGGALVVPLADAGSYLARAHERACAAQRVAAALPAAWDPAWTTTGAGADLRAVGVLHLGPVAAGRTAEVAALGATPLFTWAAQDPAALPLRLAGGQRADLRVVAVPARCDPHAVAEDKQGFAVPVEVLLDDGSGGPAVRVPVWVPRAERGTAVAALQAACAAGA